ncbi:hypothetical protein EVAR_51264_1 [Eumeta japonica]|uniref:Uncharacterized protein n=1 Tax=Eumeta variegata TaxID=151549 RepID=A0A4C1YCE1_EUMVA|nr:hypothetical protein EVAR_51264_1 [Eumeta japonica]
MDRATAFCCHLSSAVQRAWSLSFAVHPKVAMLNTIVEWRFDRARVPLASGKQRAQVQNSGSLGKHSPSRALVTTRRVPS